MSWNEKSNEVNGMFTGRLIRHYVSLRQTDRQTGDNSDMTSVNKHKAQMRL
jgi:hypothetical protein